MTNDKKKVAVVIISYNGKELLEKFLPPIINDDYDDFEVYVIDNASTDQTQEFLKSAFPQVKIITVKVNKGFTNGYVEGLQQISNEYYVLISSDMEATPGWIKPIIDLMESDRSIAACQPKVKSYDQKTLFEYSGSAGGYIDMLGYPFCRGRLFFTMEDDKGQYDDVRETFWATGGCLFIRSELYHKAGGLDNDFYAHMEEIDLCWRLKNMGYKIMVCPESVVYHVGGHIITYGSPGKIFRNFRNSLITNLKNMKANELIWKIPARIVLDIIYAYKVLFSGNFMEFKNIAKAHYHFLIYLPKWIRKRREVRKLTVDPNLYGIYNGSIVFDYFLRGKKRFSQLKF
ncbi:MAG: glycosyltransferase family 2 protein [Bacteroidota bacterium]